VLKPRGVIGVGVLNDDPLLLDVSNPELLIRKRRDEGGVLKEFFAAFDERSPGRTERRSHIHLSRIEA